MLLFVYRQHMFLFTCMISINNPFLHVLYIEQSILQTIEKPNIHYMGFFFWTVGKISKLEWLHNPSASHKIILLKLWLSLMCGVQVWQHSGAFVVQLVQQ